MKHYITLFVLGFSLLTNAQTNKIGFDYDAAGNQIKRYLCINCRTTTEKTTDVKEIDSLTEKDLQKFYSEDVISYYPNPVKEELYLKWEFSSDNTVSSIHVNNINGQVLKAVSNLQQLTTQTLAFAPYPSGLYLVVLNYSNGRQKTIKIIKK
ncbi:T9SS C-terminal target domain-containing protein [Flavobacterium cupreum]|uniref:T9SS C-terminal target domain-containing protein n=2 Tax=Flavobacterium TaxID=237 RepID=A0A434ABK8_9FLAO|nr:T9SS type A sorting domain-containing protein [Flavobacterium cupreum]RUT71682.1 T9SS C-terminal target domain-containing protein [Flavobacterium cupreum]